MAGCGMEAVRMNELEAEALLLWADRAGRQNRMDEERRNGVWRLALLDGLTYTLFFMALHLSRVAGNCGLRAV